MSSQKKVATDTQKGGKDKKARKKGRKGDFFLFSLFFGFKAGFHGNMAHCEASSQFQSQKKNLN